MIGRLPGVLAIQQEPIDVSQFKEISRPPTPSNGDFVTHDVNPGHSTKGTLFIPPQPTDGSEGPVLYLNHAKYEQRRADEAAGQMLPPSRPR
jgi:hypothetical protein